MVISLDFQNINKSVVGHNLKKLPKALKVFSLRVQGITCAAMLIFSWRILYENEEPQNLDVLLYQNSKTKLYEIVFMILTKFFATDQ